MSRLGAVLALGLWFSCASCFALIEEPASCLDQGINPCWIKNQDQPLHLKLQGQNLQLSPNSIIERNFDSWRLLQGEIWIQAQVPSLWKTSFVKIEAQGDLWIRHTDQKSIVRNLFGNSKMLSGIDQSVLPLPVGFENWYSGLSKAKTPLQGVVKPLVMKDFIKSFASSFHVSVSTVREHLSLWQQEWKGNVEQGSQIYSEAVTRHMASVQEKNDLKKQKRQSQRAEEESLRKMFRERNGLEGL